MRHLALHLSFVTCNENICLISQRYLHVLWHKIDWCVGGINADIRGRYEFYIQNFPHCLKMCLLLSYCTWLFKNKRPKTERFHSFELEKHRKNFLNTERRSFKFTKKKKWIVYKKVNSPNFKETLEKVGCY